jgi:hypothetical protein
MAQKSFLNTVFGDAGEQPAEPKPSFLTLTPRTIQLGHGSEIYQLKNITRIGKYKVLEKQFPIIGIALLALVGLAAVIVSGTGPTIFGLLLLLGAGYGIWSRMQPRTYAFGIEANSGTIRYLYAKDHAFIEEIVKTVTQYIETDQSTGMIINIEDRSINNTGFIGGSVQSGDNT